MKKFDVIYLVELIVMGLLVYYFKNNMFVIWGIGITWAIETISYIIIKRRV